MSIRPEVEVTPPLIGLGPSTVVTPVVRTGLQVLSPALVLEGLRVFHVWEPEPDQVAWLMSAGTVVFAAVQNWVEQRKGRKLLGRSTAQ